MNNFINEFKEKDSKLKKRVGLIKFCIFLFLIVISIKIFSLQLINNEEPLKFSKIQTNPFQLLGNRGEIRDSDGKILAVSVAYPSIHLNPREIKDKVYYSKILSKTLNISEAEVLKKLNKKKYFVWIKRLASHKEGKKILSLELPNVSIKMEYKRDYPFGHLAGQVLGHTNLDQVGMEGLEYKFNKELVGSKKVITLTKDGKGKIITDNPTAIENPEDGSNLNLTIKSKYQFILEKEIAKAVKKSKALRGYGVVLNPNTGEIYAMGSYPFFNPNKYSEYQDSITKRNLPAWNTFEPGSVMKSFLVATAINEGVVDDQTIIDCENGQRRIGKYIIHDVNKKGKLDVSGVLRFSSNIGASKIIEKISNKTYYSYLRSLGFGTKTNIKLPGEAKGILVAPEKWSMIQAANISFGQGMSATSLQLAKALSIIANGGIYIEPYLVKSITNSQGRILFENNSQSGKRVLSYATSKKMRQLLKSVVEDGGGHKAQIDGVSVSGKTGTGQFAIKGGYSKKRFIVSFIGFAPSDSPQLVSVITIDYPKGERAYGGRWAAPVFKKTIEKILIDEEKIKKFARVKDVPSFIGKAKREAIQMAKEKNVKIRIVGNGFVKKQTPSPGNDYIFQEEISLFLEPGI